MKLDRSILGVAVVAVSVVCGCSSSVSAPAAPHAATDEASMTELSSALLRPSAPKVGKVQLVADEDLGGGSVSDSDELTAPKEPRRATTHHRGGGFGVAK